MAKEKKENDFLTYKGRPLVRCGNVIYYGNMTDKYVVMLQVQNTTKDLPLLELADKVTVQLLATDPDIRPKDKIIKKTEKQGLYNAIDVGAIWLERALKNE